MALRRYIVVTLTSVAPSARVWATCIIQLMCLQVLLYLIRLADVCGIDLANAV